MLVLTRKIGETFLVGDDITVTVVGIVGGNKVRLGINAPAAVPVYREEIWLQIQAENRRPRPPDPTCSTSWSPRVSSPTRRSRRRQRESATAGADTRRYGICITFK